MASTHELRAIAEDALERVQSQPADVAAKAEELISQQNLDGETAVIARFALGRAHHELGLIDAACLSLEAAADEAATHRLTELEAHIRGSLALSLFTHGEADRAFVELGRAESALAGSQRARMIMQRAIILVHSGELTAGLDAFDEALPALLEGGDDLAVARLVISRGVVHSLLGDQRSAEIDFLDGAHRARSLGQTALTASAEGNLAFSCGRRGDIPEALEWFDRARRTYAETGHPGRYTAILDSDLCEVLLLAGLTEEATEAAMRSLETTRNGGNVVDAAEAQLLFARCLLAAGDSTNAREEAAQAVQLFDDADREAWAAQAEYVEAVAAESAGDKANVEQLDAIANRLQSRGWTTEALHVRTLLGRALLAKGDHVRALQHLEAASLARHRGTAVQRSQAWLALAVSRREAQNSKGALRALRAGLGVLDEHRMVLGATELRMRAGAHHDELVRMGLEIALENKRARAIFDWVELGRAGALRLPAARPPRNTAISERLTSYRALHQARAEAKLAGSPAQGDRRVAQAEKEIRDLSRRTSRARLAGEGPTDISEVRARLGDRTMLEFFEDRGELHVLTIDERRIRHSVVGDVESVRRHVDDVAFALRRLSSRPDLSSRARENVAGALASSADELVQGLLSTVSNETSELVIVPSESLYRLAWSAIRSSAHPPIIIAPSARLWRQRRRNGAGSSSVALIGGPGLEASTEELESLRALYPESALLTGVAAKVAPAMEAMSCAGVVHIAAHGTFRPTSPLFSSLELSDGPLTVYDLEQLESLPHTVVLAACNAARADVMPGGEVMSTALALLAAGVESVIAPIIAVPDQTTAVAMIELHQYLAQDVPPAVALSRATRRYPTDAVGATARAFLTFGTDRRRP